MKFLMLAPCCAVFLASCAIVDIREEVHYAYQGGQIAQPMVGQVVPGITTRQWLVDNLGQPSVEERLDDGSGQLIYQFDEHINLRTRILFLFNYHSTKVVPRQLQIALKDDVVTRVGPSYFDETENE